MKNHSAITVYICSALAILLWGMSYVWSDSLIDKAIPVEYFVFIRILIAALILLIFNLILKVNIKIQKKDFGKFVLLSLLEPFIYFICETYGISLTASPTFSSLIIASAPIISIVAGLVIFKENVNFLNILGMTICLIGIIMVTLSAPNINKYFIYGLILLLIAIVVEVGHASYTKHLSMGGYAPQVIVMYQFLFGSVFLLPLFLTKGLNNFDAEIYLSSQVLVPILCLAFFCSGIAFSLWAVSISHLGVAKSSIFLAMIPVVTALSGELIGNEHLNSLQWLGISISCIGVVVSQLNYKRKNSTEESI